MADNFWTPWHTRTRAHKRIPVWQETAYTFYRCYAATTASDMPQGCDDHREPIPKGGGRDDDKRAPKIKTRNAKSSIQARILSWMRCCAKCGTADGPITNTSADAAAAARWCWGSFWAKFCLSPRHLGCGSPPTITPPSQNPSQSTRQKQTSYFERNLERYRHRHHDAALFGVTMPC